MIGHKEFLTKVLSPTWRTQIAYKRTYRVYMHTYMFPLPHVTYIVVAAFSLTWTSDQVHIICYSNPRRVSQVTYLYGGFLKWWVYPTNPWVFLLKMIILGCDMGVPPFTETPISYLFNKNSFASYELERIEIPSS